MLTLPLLVRRDVPQVRTSETGVRLPHAHLLVYPLLNLLQLILDLLQRKRVWSLALRVSSKP